MTFILWITKEDGLPLQGDPHEDVSWAQASCTAKQMTNIRGRIFEFLLNASLDPPSNPCEVDRGISELCASWCHHISHSAAPSESAVRVRAI